MTLFIRNMLQLILSPSRGWEDIETSHASSAGELLSRGVIPAFILAALSIFAQVIYHLRIDKVDLLVGACVIFVSYFATLAIASKAFSAKVLKWSPKCPVDRALTVVYYALGLMAVTTTVCNLMPITLGLGYLLPLAITLIVWKSMGYLMISENKEYTFLAYEFVVITLPPILIQAFFSWLLQG